MRADRCEPLRRATGVSRRLCALVFVALAATSAHVTWAQEAYPSKPVKFINAFPPGGPSDLLARSLAEVFQARFKQPFVVENKAGAGGNLGADVVAKSAPDGYTVLVSIDTSVTINPALYKSLPYAVSDLKPLMILASSGLLLGVHPGLGVKSMPELVARGKARGLSFSSGSNGSPGHLEAEMFTELTGAKVTHVPYKGNTPAVTAVLSGEVDGGVLATPGMLPFVKSGKIQALAVTSRARSPLAPDVPTVAELGMKDLEFEVLYLAMVPAATPEPVVQTLQRAMADALALPDIKARMGALDLVPELQSGPAAIQRLQALQSRYARLIKATGMKID